MSQPAYRVMKAQRYGRFVFVSSSAGLFGQPASAHYAAAKAGLNALTIGFADAFGPTVRVNAIMPGPFRTDVTKAWPKEPPATIP